MCGSARFALVCLLQVFFLQLRTRWSYANCLLVVSLTSCACSTGWCNARKFMAGIPMCIMAPCCSGRGVIMHPSAHGHAGGPWDIPTQPRVTSLLPMGSPVARVMLMHVRQAIASVAHTRPVPSGPPSRVPRPR